MANIAPKNWIQTFTGKCFDLDNIETNVYDIEDISHSLSMQCRYNGHTKKFYSVAEHSWRCSYLVEPGFEFEALMHDASEAYISDMARPIKNMMPSFKEIEIKIEKAIAQNFKLPETMSPEVKFADNNILYPERELLMARPPYVWENYGVEGYTIQQFNKVSRSTFTPEQAEQYFLKRYMELWPAHLTKYIEQIIYTEVQA